MSPQSCRPSLRLTLPPTSRPSLRPSAPPKRLGFWPRAGYFARRALLRVRLLTRDAKPSLRRAFDVLGAGLGLLLIGPVLLVAIAAVKLTSPGPAFFRQERVGLQGQRFAMWKLRTMYVDAERRRAELVAARAEGNADLRFKMRRDPRVTPVGRYLRKFSVDELPQLINVLRGDMTLIGPRPAIWSEVSLYDATALRRLEVPQGLTCLWQVEGRSDLSFEKQVELDLQYVDRVGLWGTIQILLKTIPAVITGRGAY